MVRVLREVEKVASSGCYVSARRRWSASPEVEGSLSYLRLPEQMIRLEILKLDGSCFDVQVGKSASVSELKLAVENVFSQSNEEGQGKISWTHVWGHFCLCYDGNKLINDKISLRNFKLKDGDQLQFIRHVSINYIPLKGRPKNCESEPEEPSMSSRKSKDQALRQSQKNEETNGPQGSTVKFQKESYHSKDDDDYLLQNADFWLGNFLRVCLSYTKSWGMGASRKASFGTYCQGIGAGRGEGCKE